MEPQKQSDKNNDIVSSNQKPAIVSGEFNPISFFKKDKNFVFAHQKIEKLVAAVYMLTNFFPAEEPIKWSLRNLGTKLLRLNIDLKESSPLAREDVENAIRNTVLEVVSLLEVASFASLVSEMNINILKREFHALLSHINKMLHREELEDSALFGAPFFATETLSEPNQNRDKERKETYEVSSHMSRSHREISERDVEDAIKDKNQESLSKTKKLKEFGPVAVKKNKRQSIIINLLKRKKEIMVKDVAEIVHDCSEKTLQRELLSLVSQGVLTKQGERRWTRYSLAA